MSNFQLQDMEFGKFDEQSIKNKYSIRSKLVNEDGTTISVQEPLPTDGDSVYAKDIDLDNSTSTGWTGDIKNLFICPNDKIGLYNDNTTNPKVIYIAFCRTLYLNAIGFGCNLSGKTFSNVKIEFIGSDGTVRSTFDDSSNSTKYGTNLFSFSPTACIAIKIYFYTANTDIGLTNLTIRKEISTTARIRALNPDDIITDIGATKSGALRESIEDGQTGKRAEVESLGALKTVIPARLVGTTFNNGIKDTNFWTETVTGSGSVTQAGQIILATGTTADSTAKYQTIRKARKVNGAANQFRSVGRVISSLQADNEMRIGAFDTNNGFYAQFDGTTFGVGTRTNVSGSPVDTVVENGSFNGNLGATIDFDENVYTRVNIEYNSRAVRFFLNGYLIHTITATTVPLVNNIDLPVTVEIINKNGNDNDNSYALLFASIIRLGELTTSSISKYINTATTTICKYGSGKINKIINWNNAGTVTLYDNTAASGTIIGVLDALKVVGSIAVDIPFNNGLTVVTVGSVGITVVYE